MGPSPVQWPAVLAKAGHFVDDILAVALDIAVDDQRTNSDGLSNHDGMEEFPFLAGVKIAVNSGQVPGQRPVYLGMEQ